MENYLTSKKIVWAFGIIGVLAVVAIVVAAMVRPANGPSTQTNQPTEIVQKDIEPSKLPDKFPADIPQEAGAAITKNDVQTASDGRFQATRSFITAKSLDENFRIYQDYFTKTGWTVTDTVKQPRYQVISATKGNLNIQVSMNDNSVTNQKTVDIYVVEKVD